MPSFPKSLFQNHKGTHQRPRYFEEPISFETGSKPRAAYIHVPFCARKCGYCNFTVVAGRDELIEAYLKAIELELALLNEPQEVDTLYFGGGTPLHLPPKALRRLLTTVLRWHPLASNYELTLEANPNNLNAAKADVLAEFGVTRVSLGAQSFNASKLQRLERDHNADDITQAVERIQSIGADVAIDLIFAAPGESPTVWKSDLTNAMALTPEHLSVYGLTIERGSAFYGMRTHGILQELCDETQRDYYLEAITQLTNAGWEHYEISNFAKEGKRSRHNQVYWRGEPYFAAGPGAARYVNGIRSMNHRSTTTYIKRMIDGKTPIAEEESQSEEARARELLIFSLRMLEGISRSDFAKRTGMSLENLAGEPIRRFIGMGFLEDDGERIRLTQEGLLVSDALWPDFL